MTKYCVSCGAANSNSASVCARCGKAFRSGFESTKSRTNGIIAFFVFVSAIFLLIYLFIGKESIPVLSEAECENIFSATIQEERESLEGIFQEGRVHEPIDFSIISIEQDDKNAVVTYKLSAKYNYADCDAVYRCSVIYTDTTKTWEQVNSERECNWNYHGLEGVWQEKDWSQSVTMEFDFGPSVMSVVKTADGYQFTATDNWVDKYQDTQVEVKMTDLSNSIEGIHGGIRLFPKGYQSEMYSQCYNLSPEEGITDMEKIE